MKNRRGPLRSGLLAALVLAAGCATQDFSGTAQNTYRGGEDAAELETDIGDRHLERQLAMRSVRTERRDGRLFVQFELQNTTRYNLAVEWTMVWVDDRGFQVDSARTWSPLQLGGNASEFITRTAPTPDAVGFTLGLRKPNPVE